MALVGWNSFRGPAMAMAPPCGRLWLTIHPCNLSLVTRQVFVLHILALPLEQRFGPLVTGRIQFSVFLPSIVLQVVPQVPWTEGRHLLVLRHFRPIFYSTLHTTKRALSTLPKGGLLGLSRSVRQELLGDRYPPRVVVRCPSKLLQKGWEGQLVGTLRKTRGNLVTIQLPFWSQNTPPLPVVGMAKQWELWKNRFLLWLKRQLQASPHLSLTNLRQWWLLAQVVSPMNMGGDTNRVLDQSQWLRQFGARNRREVEEGWPTIPLSMV